LYKAVDYFPPVVDDPYTFGCIADRGFPALGVGFSVLGQVMSGGISMLHKAGWRLLGNTPCAMTKSNLVTLGLVVETQNVKQNKGRGTRQQYNRGYFTSIGLSKNREF